MKSDRPKCWPDRPRGFAHPKTLLPPPAFLRPPGMRSEMQSEGRRKRWPDHPHGFAHPKTLLPPPVFLRPRGIRAEMKSEERSACWPNPSRDFAHLKKPLRRGILSEMKSDRPKCWPDRPRGIAQPKKLFSPPALLRPSKAAVIFLRPTAGNENGRRLSSGTTWRLFRLIARGSASRFSPRTRRAIVRSLSRFGLISLGF
jgi:hypothetical protein